MQVHVYSQKCIHLFLGLLKNNVFFLCLQATSGYVQGLILGAGELSKSQRMAP